MPPPHHRHGHHHGHPPRPHHGLRISGTTIARANDILTQFVDNRVAYALVDQAIDGPPEPTSQFFAAVGIAETLATALRAGGVLDLHSFGTGIIDPDSDLRFGLRIESDEAGPLAKSFPKDAAVICKALADGPSEMCAVAVVQALNARLAEAIVGQSKVGST